MNKYLVLLFCCIPLLVKAQEDRMNTDLPDQSDGTYTMKPQQLQVEEKLWFNYFDEHENAFISSTLIRFGVTKKLEARLLVEEGKGRDVFMEETAQAGSPLAFSMKLALLKKHKWLPDLTAVGYLQLPATSRSSEKHELWSPTFLLAAEKKIKKWTVSLNGGIKENNFDTEITWTAVSSIRYQAGKRTQVFGEYFAQYGAAIHPLHNVDAGIQYDITKRIQLFLTAGTAIDAEEWNSFAASGLAFKLF